MPSTPAVRRYRRNRTIITVAGGLIGGLGCGLSYTHGGAFDASFTSSITLPMVAGLAMAVATIYVSDHPIFQYAVAASALISAFVSMLPNPVTGLLAAAGSAVVAAVVARGRGVLGPLLATVRRARTASAVGLVVLALVAGGGGSAAAQGGGTDPTAAADEESCPLHIEVRGGHQRQENIRLIERRAGEPLDPDRLDEQPLVLAGGEIELIVRGDLPMLEDGTFDVSLIGGDPVDPLWLPELTDRWPWSGRDEQVAPLWHGFIEEGRIEPESVTLRPVGRFGESYAVEFGADADADDDGGAIEACGPEPESGAEEESGAEGRAEPGSGSEAQTVPLVAGRITILAEITWAADNSTSRYLAVVRVEGDPLDTVGGRAGVGLASVGTGIVAASALLAARPPPPGQGPGGRPPAEGPRPTVTPSATGEAQIVGRRRNGRPEPADHGPVQPNSRYEVMVSVNLEADELDEATITDEQSGLLDLLTVKADVDVNGRVQIPMEFETGNPAQARVAFVLRNAEGDELATLTLDVDAEGIDVELTTPDSSSDELPPPEDDEADALGGAEDRGDSPDGHDEDSNQAGDDKQPGAAGE